MIEWQIDPLAGVYQSWIFAMTIITFLTYWYDKIRAISGHRPRVPERVLLALTLAGGTIGALVGMVLVNHKTSKRSFQIKFWMIVAIQLGAFLVYRTVYPGQ